MRKMGVLLLVVFLSAGCEEEFTDCKLGELTGNWEVSYQEVSGTCGPLTTEVVVIENATTNPSCTVYSDISADKCRITIDQTCPIPEESGGGTVRGVQVVDHIAPSRLSGTFTATLDQPNAYCKSTYNVDWREL